MDSNSWAFVSQMLQGFGQVGSVVVAFYAVRLVQNYTRKRDEAEFIRNRWNEQAQINLSCLSNEEVLMMHEVIVYGEAAKSNPKLARKFFLLFSIINQVQHLYIAWKHGVLSKDEFEEFSLGTVRLIKREEETVKYLLTERGYSEGFRNAFLPLLGKVTPVQFPPVQPGPTACATVSDS